LKKKEPLVSCPEVCKACFVFSSVVHRKDLFQMQYVRLLPSSVVLCLYFVRRSLQVQGQAYHDEGNNGLTLCEQHS
jgi:hypothetical protein